jgi:hypothetical protein
VHRPAPPPGEFDAEEGVSFETSKGVKVRKQQLEWGRNGLASALNSTVKCQAGLAEGMCASLIGGVASVPWAHPGELTAAGC